MHYRMIFFVVVKLGININFIPSHASCKLKFCSNHRNTENNLQVEKEDKMKCEVQMQKISKETLFPKAKG